MKVTILGCGTSAGVPIIGNNWGACDPKEPKNRRLRSSILVQEDDTTLLVDTSPDMRQQLLNCNLQSLTAVLYTHAHGDHCHGIDELRAVNWLIKKQVAVYADPMTMQELKNRFGYIFDSPAPDQFYKPAVEPHIIEGPFDVGGLTVIPFVQNHGKVTSLGFRFKDFAYTTDAKALDEDAYAALEGVKVWVVDCVREAEHPTHSHLSQTLEWIARVRPERAYLTHMNNTMDYATLKAKLPPGIEPAYDRLVVEC